MKFSALVLALSLTAVDAVVRGENFLRNLKADNKAGSGASGGGSSSTATSMAGSGSSSGSSSTTSTSDCTASPDNYALDGSDPDGCLICRPCEKVRPPTLTLEYNPVGANSLYQDETKASCRADTYPTNPTSIEILGKAGDFRETWSTVAPGVTFTLSGTAAGNTQFDSETRFRIAGWSGGDGAGGNECFIHTSCSQPLVAGDQIGPFIVREGNGCTGTAAPVTPAPVTPPPVATEQPCIEVDTSIDYCNGAPIPVTFDYAEAPMPAMIDDWIGIYPCATEIYKHAIVWQWACGGLPSQCSGIAQSGTVVFDSEPSYNAVGPHYWPTGVGCFKAVILRNDGPSVPPYIPICESTGINVIQC